MAFPELPRAVRDSGPPLRGLRRARLRATGASRSVANSGGSRGVRLAAQPRRRDPRGQHRVLALGHAGARRRLFDFLLALAVRLLFSGKTA